jgi:hypothetical protein
MAGLSAESITKAACGRRKHQGGMRWRDAVDKKKKARKYMYKYKDTCANNKRDEFVRRRKPAGKPRL